MYSYLLAIGRCPESQHYSVVLIVRVGAVGAGAAFVSLGVSLLASAFAGTVFNATVLTREQTKAVEKGNINAKKSQ